MNLLSFYLQFMLIAVTFGQVLTQNHTTDLKLTNKTQVIKDASEKFAGILKELVFVNEKIFNAMEHLVKLQEQRLFGPNLRSGQMYLPYFGQPRQMDHRFQSEIGYGKNPLVDYRFQSENGFGKDGQMDHRFQSENRYGKDRLLDLRFQPVDKPGGIRQIGSGWINLQHKARDDQVGPQFVYDHNNIVSNAPKKDTNNEIVTKPGVKIPIFVPRHNEPDFGIRQVRYRWLTNQKGSDVKTHNNFNRKDRFGTSLRGKQEDLEFRNGFEGRQVKLALRSKNHDVKGNAIPLFDFYGEGFTDFRKALKRRKPTVLSSYLKQRKRSKIQRRPFNIL